MAGDSEQTLQNHQQPNGGEPFLIGVSGGTASGKVSQGPRAPYSRGGRHMWPAPAGRGSCSLPPRGPRGLRSGPPPPAPRRLGARRWGPARVLGRLEGPRCGASPTPARRDGALPRRFPAAVAVVAAAGTRGQGPVGEGREADAYCFASRGWGRGFRGSPHEPHVCCSAPA